jgi:hypothetical protein
MESMKRAMSSSLILPSLLLAATAGGAVIDLRPGLHLIPIQTVTYQNGAITTVQTTEAAGVDSTSDAPLTIKSVAITDAGPVELSHFNTEAAVAVNANPELGNTGGVGVFKNGVHTHSAGNLANYVDAFSATALDSDLRHFTFHDYLTPGPTTSGVPDIDLLFYRALEQNDYFLIAERWGNSHFSVTALKEDGTVYAGSNTLRIGGPGGTFGVGYEVYDWNTGYAASSNVSTQAQALSLFSVRMFFDGTNVQAGPIYGLRIDNDGEADPKIMGISADTFDDNPINPQVVPEASTVLLALGGAMLVFRRRRD